MRRNIALALIVGLALTAGSAWAHATRHIVGSPRNDVLRGTPRADVIQGRGGNDKLFGLAGRDVLVGGPGADVIHCGRGRDVVRADAQDVVSGDCEVVTGLPPTNEPPPPPTEPPPPTAHALPGRYCGFTNQGKTICVTVAPDSTRVTTYRLNATVTCGSETGTFSFVTFGPGPIQADLTFSRSVDEPRPDSTDLKNIRVAWEINGTFDTKGNVTGTFFLKHASFDDASGRHSECTSAPTGWQAKVGA